MTRTFACKPHPWVAAAGDRANPIFAEISDTLRFPNTLGKEARALRETLLGEVIPPDGPRMLSPPKELGLEPVVANCTPRKQGPTVYRTVHNAGGIPFQPGFSSPKLVCLRQRDCRCASATLDPARNRFSISAQSEKVLYMHRNHGALLAVLSILLAQMSRWRRMEPKLQRLMARTSSARSTEKFYIYKCSF